MTAIVFGLRNVCRSTSRRRSGRPETSTAERLAGTAGRSVGMRQLRGKKGGNGAATLPRSPEFAAKAHQYDVSVRYRATWKRGHGRLGTHPRLSSGGPHEEGVSPANHRNRRHVARGSARRRDVASRGLRRPRRRDRRGAAPPVRPAAAVQGTARREVRTRRRRAAQTGRRRTSISTGVSGDGRPRSTSRRARSPSTTATRSRSTA